MTTTIQILTFSTMPELALEGWDPNACDAADYETRRAAALYEALGVDPKDDEYALAQHTDGRWALIGLTASGHRYAVEVPNADIALTPAETADIEAQALAAAELPATTIEIVLSSANMGDVDEDDFDIWAGYVADEIDAAMGFEVKAVDQQRFGESGEDIVTGGSAEQRAAVRQWLKVGGWDAFCGQGGPWETRRAALAAANPAELVIVYLRGGDSSDSDAAAAVDLDRGLTTHGEEWSALVRRDRVEELLGATGATQIGEPAAWDGSPFGDGNSGTVERQADGELVGAGLHRSGLEAA